MVKVRQDAWSHEDDSLLAETVLRHIQDGSTQLNAFEEVGDALNRTSAACGFRWNAEVRNHYIQPIELAKKQRKQLKRAQAATKKSVKPIPKMIESIPQDDYDNLMIEPEAVGQSEMSLHSIIEALQSFAHNQQHSMRIKHTTEKLQSENHALLNKITTLEQELQLKEKRLATVEEDYHTFIQIMERARKMTVLEDYQSEQSPTFKMDKNGNLEQVYHGQSNS